ncbi:hypothetical protein AVEN_149511-1 [Araneus ventricosus]|uniref:Uncharacterized protein n=1 Tax=Araneus ventricosus TaxID=182803 RepID=A0A4Y2QDE1_ARAVE|nr:hypothetical protein AVEN_149511-1 [Araneus ventricosus]
MQVACMDARDFYGDHLVRELRMRMEGREIYTNPIQNLALRNAGEETTTTLVVERVTTDYDSQHRPFWTETFDNPDYKERYVSSYQMTCVRLARDLKFKSLPSSAMSDGKGNFQPHVSGLRKQHSQLM